MLSIVSTLSPLCGTDWATHRPKSMQKQTFHSSKMISGRYCYFIYMYYFDFCNFLHYDSRAQLVKVQRYPGTTTTLIQPSKYYGVLSRPKIVGMVHCCTTQSNQRMLLLHLCTRSSSIASLMLNKRRNTFDRRRCSSLPILILNSNWCFFQGFRRSRKIWQSS